MSPLSQPASRTPLRPSRFSGGLMPHRLRGALSGTITAVLAAALLLSGVATADPVPPPPPNPSDQEIQESQDAASSAAAKVGVLAGMVSKTQSRIDRLRADLETKGELAKKAVIDLQLAQQDAERAQLDAHAAAGVADAAGGAVSDAETKAAQFAAASFRQGSVLGSMTAFMDAGDAADLLGREQLLRQVSANQADVISQLQTTRNEKTNLDSDARSAQDQAVAAKARATELAVAARQAQQDASTAFAQGAVQMTALQTELDDQQTAYGDALGHVAGLKDQRQQYETWLAQKRAEEERLRLEALQRAREAAARLAAEQAAAEQAAAAQAAEAQATARALAAEKAAEAKAKALQIATAEAAAARTAAARATARRAAEAKASADREAARQAAAERSAQARAAASKGAAARQELARSRAAKAAADRQAIQRAAQLTAARRAQERLASAQAGRNKVYYASCADAEAAHRTPLLKGSPGYRIGLDRNRNGVACEVLSDSAAQLNGSGTTPAPVVSAVYYSSCAEAQLLGSIPIQKGQPGYRIGLDTNKNGIACEILSTDGSASGGSSSSGGSSGGGVAASRNDPGSSAPGAWSAARGQAAVAAAERWVGTPYSWGGGNSGGPTTGICGPNGAENDCNIVGFDCSGLTSYGWAQEGVSIPSYSVYQYTLGQHISISDLVPGDLLFYANDTSDPSTIHHVAMYAGGGQMVEAPYSGAYVQVVSANFGNGYIGATRPGT